MDLAVELSVSDGQVRNLNSDWRSMYIWMVWIEISSCAVVIAGTIAQLGKRRDPDPGVETMLAARGYNMAASPPFR